jgi:sulfoxide reductase catalytic subunit YedY
MANVILPPGWRIPDREASPESVFFNRRAFLQKSGLGIAALGLGCGSEFTPTELTETPDAPPAGVGCNGPAILHPLQPICDSPNDDLYPVVRNLAFDTPPSGLTSRLAAAVHNNFYEFIGSLDNVNLVWPHTAPFNVWPWSVEVTGEAELTGTFDVAELEREFGLEERVYRHRCVERWAMTVPWIGYPLAKLIDKFRPLSSANYVRFVSFSRPEEAVGQRIQPDFPWPYYEALRLDEARNELAFVVTGVYGEPLPKQHGAPWRLALPWKYGFKSTKSMVRIEFLRDEPSTFWKDSEPSEYGFYSNVNPHVPHPRWSQSFETPLGTSAVVETQLFNGYQDYVGDLYDPALLEYIS